MKLEFEGRAWLLEPLDAGLKQCETIAAYTGLPSLNAWYKSLFDADAAGWLKSVQCLHWLMKAQNGVEVDIQGAEFAPLRLLEAFTAATLAELKAAGEGEADPTSSAAGNAAAAQALPPTPPG